MHCHSFSDSDSKLTVDSRKDVFSLSSVFVWRCNIVTTLPRARLTSIPIAQPEHLRSATTTCRTNDGLLPSYHSKLDWPCWSLCIVVVQLKILLLPVDDFSQTSVCDQQSGLYLQFYPNEFLVTASLLPLLSQLVDALYIGNRNYLISIREISFIFTRTWLRYVRVFAIAIPSVCLSSVVCRLSVCNVNAPYSGGWTFRQNFFTAVYAGHPLTSMQNFTEIVPGEPLRRGR